MLSTTKANKTSYSNRFASLFRVLSTSQFLLLLVTFTQCSNNSNSNIVSSNDSLVIRMPDGLSTNINDSFKSKLNFTDKNGLKQGKWIRTWKGKIIEERNYKNNRLHGYFCINDGMLYEGYYLMGKREGLFHSYYGNKASIMMTTYYINDSPVWSGFPTTDGNLLIHIKRFVIYRDTVFIRATHQNGKPWYNGNFCLRPERFNNTRRRTYPLGIHEIFHKNGKLKGIVNYPNKTIEEFDTAGIRLYKSHFENHEIHKQSLSSDDYNL